MEYIWTRPPLTHTENKGRMHEHHLIFFFLVPLPFFSFSKADSLCFYCSSFVHLIIDVRDAFLFVHLLFPPLLIMLPFPCCTFFLSYLFMTLHISPLPNVESKKEAARRGGSFFFFFFSFFRLRSIVFLSFFFLPVFLWWQSEWAARVAKLAKYVRMQIARKNLGLQERMADTETGGGEGRCVWKKNKK